MINKMRDKFKEYFNHEPEYYINTGGRLEIIGNHTDHNHGLCLVANCSLRIHAAIKPLENEIKIKSTGYRFFEFSLDELEVNNDDHSTTALCRGILFKLKELGYKVGGFEAYIESDIPKGSGVSSSAAIESLFGYLISYLYNYGKIDSFTIAKVGQFAENNYFHKPSGLLDQIGTSYGSSNFIDFHDIDNPMIDSVPFDLPVDIYLIKSEGNHAGLTDLYARIPTAMNKAASLLGDTKYLGDVEVTEDIDERIDKLNLDQDTKNIAHHFFIENTNVMVALISIKHNDLLLFLGAVRSSQESSHKNLKNTYVQGEYKGSPQAIIDDLSKLLDDETGAIRIHGGGFKGTVIAYVRKDKSKEFKEYLDKNYKNKYYPVTISKEAFVIKKY